MQTADSVWVELAEKRRPGVVIEAEPDRVRIIYGTTEERTYPSIAVHPETRIGRAWPLSDTTYFYGANVQWLMRRALVRGRRPVTPDLLLGLRKLVLIYEATLPRP